MGVGGIPALATTIHRVPVTRRLALAMAVVSLYSIAVASSGTIASDVAIHFEPDIHSFVGFVLGLLLVFRTNTAYERWWEARKIWGQLVNDSRNLSVKLTHLVSVPQGDRVEIGRILVAFARSLRDSLQDSPPATHTLPDQDGIATAASPVELVCSLYKRIRQWTIDGIVDGFEVAALDVHLRSLLEIVGGCERIRRTRLSASYRAFVRQCIFLYLLLLPWCLVESYGVWTIPAMIVVSYFMIGIELIAETVEQPFGSSDDHIPLDGICDKLAESIFQIVAPCDVPYNMAA